MPSLEIVEKVPCTKNLLVGTGVLDGPAGKLASMGNFPEYTPEKPFLIGRISGRTVREAGPYRTFLLSESAFLAGFSFLRDGRLYGWRKNRFPVSGFSKLCGIIPRKHNILCTGKSLPKIPPRGMQNNAEKCQFQRLTIRV